jgi:hypothetical protein
MPFNEQQKQRNQQALERPQVGDYWQEMFCPYFIVVELLDDQKYRVLSCLGGPRSFTRKDEPCAYIDFKNGTWGFDYSADMIVDREWMAKAVKYEHIEGFCADVDNNTKTQLIANEWRVHRANILRQEWEAKKAEWEKFTGWSYLKDNMEE